jgi:hypothetical protein
MNPMDTNVQRGFHLQILDYRDGVIIENYGLFKVT